MTVLKALSLLVRGRSRVLVREEIDVIKAQIRLYDRSWYEADIDRVSFIITKEIKKVK